MENTAGSLNEQLATASSLMQQGNLPAAEAVIATAKTTHDSVASVWALASEISLRQGKIGHAWTEVNRAVNLDTHNARRHVQRARCAILAGLVTDAKQSVDAAAKAGVTEVDDQLMLASVLVRCDDHEGALAWYRKAEAIQPERNELQRGMASVYRFTGDIDKAGEACNKALAADPHDYEMLNLRSSLRRQTRNDNHIQELKERLEKGVRDWRGAVQVAYAVSKELEDIEQYDEAFQYLEKGASLRRRNLKYDLDDDIKIFHAIKSAFTREALEAAAGHGYASDAPIFILGLPRTGSTLVERIVSSHSMVITAGELNDFALELLKLTAAGNRGRQPARLELPGASLAVDMHGLGQNYVNSVKPLLKDTPRFIDKLPLNSLYVGLICLALPRARVVHVNRHPVDTCFAIYKYLFKNAYPFSYDLGELGDYYIEHHRLVEHWRKVLPDGWMYDIRYEDIVDDQRQETEKLLDYLDLEWEDSCLEFHRNEQASTTGSASQVRQPLYGSSVGKWNNYEKQLMPLIDKLKTAGIDID
ncbi:MAG: sulfotransferase [Gammaproteobacteria bacterium]|nr:sulfotransferase [Gammaproteobacteria bacterium]